MPACGEQVEQSPFRLFQVLVDFYPLCVFHCIAFFLSTGRAKLVILLTDEKCRAFASPGDMGRVLFQQSPGWFVASG